MTRRPLWTAVDAASATGGRSRRSWQADRVSIDSRSTEQGDLFVALRGPTNDGHDHVADALARGAAAAVVEKRPDSLPEDAPLLLVDDTMQALEAMAGFARRNFQGTLVGITGSVGKTGMKEALARICSRFAATHASAKSHNNHWGVPLTLANLAGDDQYAVVEMGMNHSGEIAALTAMARPHVALITAIAPAHLEFFSSIDDIAQAKGEIFRGLVPGGVAVINIDAPSSEILVSLARQANATIIGFGEGEGARVRLLGHEARADGSRVRARFDSRELVYDVGIPGRHWAINSLALLAVAHVLELPTDTVLEEIARLEPVAGRGKREVLALADGGSVMLIDESYNANPASMRAAFSLLAAQSGAAGRGSGRHARARREFRDPACRARRATGRSGGRRASDLWSPYGEPTRGGAIADRFSPCRDLGGSGSTHGRDTASG